MSNLLEELGKVAGAVIAEQSVAKLDPNANFLEKAAAAVAGFEGTKLAENALGEKYQEYKSSDTEDDNQDHRSENLLSDDNQADEQADDNDNNERQDSDYQANDTQANDDQDYNQTDDNQANDDQSDNG